MLDMSLELCIGPMFSGKSTFALAYIRRNRCIGKKVLCITSSLDTRYSSTPTLITHDKEMVHALSTDTLTSIRAPADYEVATHIVIEEAQFFPDLKEFVLHSVEHDEKHVLCVGLDGDCRRRPFGQILELIPFCNSVNKRTALCKKCMDGTEAIFTSRNDDTEHAVEVGDASKYEAVCRKHYLTTADK